MLKGILFVIAIIITFDIGKALIDAWSEDETSPKPQIEKTEPEAVEGLRELLEEDDSSNQTLKSSDSKINIWSKPKQWLQKDEEKQSSKKQEENPEELAEESSAEDASVPTIIDYTLPPEDLSKSENSEALNEGKDSSSNLSSKMTDINKEKKVTMSAKPIVGFGKTKEELIDIEKPKLEGARVGIKVKLD